MDLLPLHSLPRVNLSTNECLRPLSPRYASSPSRTERRGESVQNDAPEVSPIAGYA
jgi:hypothetical protein